MQRVKLGATRLEVTPLAYGTWQFGGDWGPVDEIAAMAAIQHARSPGIKLAEIDHIMATALPVGGPTPEGMA